MLLPNNINYLKKEDFGNNTSKINICFTNKKRIEINNLKMTRAIKDSHISTSKILKLDKLDYDDKYFLDVAYIMNVKERIAYTIHII